MLNITLICHYGASTGMLAKNIQEAAKLRNIEANVHAYGQSELKRVAPQSDVILVGPQLKFEQAQMEKAFPEIPFYSIEPLEYGSMNGKKVLENALKTIQTFKGI